MQKCIVHGVTVVIVSMATFSAFAADDPVAIHSNVTLSNLQYTLTDLNTRDLIKPSLKSKVAGNQAVSFEATGFGTPGKSGINATPFDAINGGVAGPIGYFPVPTSGASKTGNSLSSQVTLTRDQVFNVGALPALNQPYAAMGSSGSTNSYSSWVLSAGTQLVVTGLANLDVGINTLAVTQPASATAPNLYLEARDYYTVNLLSGEDFDEKVVDTTSGELKATQQSTAYGPAATDITNNSSSQSFSLMVQNLSTKSMVVSLNMLLYANGTIMRATAVPEPGTYALMALGLGLMAWRVRTARRA